MSGWNKHVRVCNDVRDKIFKKKKKNRRIKKNKNTGFVRFSFVYIYKKNLTFKLEIMQILNFRTCDAYLFYVSCAIQRERYNSRCTWRTTLLTNSFERMRKKNIILHSLCYYHTISSSDSNVEREKYFFSVIAAKKITRGK